MKNVSYHPSVFLCLATMGSSVLRFFALSYHPSEDASSFATYAPRGTCGGANIYDGRQGGAADSDALAIAGEPQPHTAHVVAVVWLRIPDVTCRSCNGNIP